MSVAPLAAGRHSVRGSRPTTQDVEEGFRFGGPGRATRDPPKDHQPRYAAHLATLHRLIPRGAHSLGAGMRFASLKASYPKEYAELAAEARGQGELL
jgi:hypothetical protein